VSFACGDIPEEEWIFPAAGKAHVMRSFYEFSKQCTDENSPWPRFCVDHFGRRAPVAAMPPILSLNFPFLRDVN
jgi:hypothetical protein